MASWLTTAASNGHPEPSPAHRWHRRTFLSFSRSRKEQRHLSEFGEGAPVVFMDGFRNGSFTGLPGDGCYYIRDKEINQLIQVDTS